MGIEVLNIQKITGKGALKGFATIRIGEAEIRDLRIVQQDNQKPWVGSPCYVWRDDEGKSHYKPLIIFPEKLKGDIEAAVLAEYFESDEGAPF